MPKRPLSAVAAADDDDEVVAAERFVSGEEQEQSVADGGSEATQRSLNALKKAKKKQRRKAEAAVAAASESQEVDADADADSTGSAAGRASRLEDGRLDDGSEQFTVFVSGLQYETTEDELRAFFKGAGKIESVRMPLYRDTGRCLGYAHVQFNSEEAVAAACKLNGKSLRGRYLDIAPARSRDAKQVSRPRKPDAPCKTIFVKNIPYDTQEDELGHLFKPFGEVAAVRLGIDTQTGRCKGFAYVEFTNAASTDTAVSQSNGKLLRGRKLQVDYETGQARASYKGALKWKLKGRPDV